MDIIEIASKINEAGGQLYLVGGAVRDNIMNTESNDKDYCITGLTKDEFLSLFPTAYEIGKSFKVFNLFGNEFALARSEIKTGIGHKNFEIITKKNITISDDLFRRDLTINAIAINVLTNEIIDPFNGLKDIQDKRIRAVSDKFIDDPLRVYRVARFASILGFDVDNNTIKLMKNLKNELNSLSNERVFGEFSKALSSNKPSIFFDVLKTANVLDVHFKEIYDLIGAIQDKRYHPEGDAYNHTMLSLDKSVELTEDLKIRFSVLVHDLGKGITPKNMYPHHYDHEILGVDLVSNLGNRICTPNNWIKCGKTSCREHMRGGIFSKMRPAKKIEFIERVSRSYLGLEGLQKVVICDKLSSRNINQADISFEDIGKKCLATINGDYILKKYGIQKGTQFADKLKEERIKWLKKISNII